MEALLYFAFWAGLIFLMMRMGCGARAMGHGPDRGADDPSPGAGGQPGLRWVAPEKDTDPVCGKTISTGKAKSSVHAGSVYYFCSRDCREAFEAAPDLYVGAGGANQPRLEHSHV